MSGYKTRHGIDYWPAEMSDLYIDLMYGKRWRQFKVRHPELDVERHSPWRAYLDGLVELYGDAFRVSPWTEDHVRNWVMHEKPIYWGGASCGKFTLMTEPVFTPTGVTTVGSLSVGDYIIAATGHPARVEKIFEQEDRPLYIVRFGDGTETVCGDEHLWTVRYWGRVRWEGPRKTRKAVDGFVTRTMTTERLASWTDLRRRRASVPLTEPVEFNRREVPVDPYMLGCLIGDGSLCGTISLASHPDDAELRGRFRQGLAAKFPGYELHATGSRGTEWLVTGSGRGHANAVKSALRDLGLFGHRAETKFVPDMYKFNSADVRFELLAGLFDTDGTVSKKGHVSYCTVSKRLAEDVKFLLQSVGASATVFPKTPTYTHDGVRRSGQTAYTVHVHGLKKCYMRRLFHLSRKRNRICSLRTEGYKSIESVTRVVDRASYPSRTRCITLSKYDTAGNLVEGLYPIGNFTVTHNSNDVAACIVPDWFIDPYDTIVLVGSTTKDALRVRVWEAIERYFATAKQYAEAHGFLIPGKVTQTGYAILNDRAGDDNPNAQGGKAGIHGVALNEGGKLQGAHLPFVRVVIDEIATIANHQAIIDTVSNLIVADDFKFAAMANPEAWSTPSSSIYCTPVGGIKSVNVDTREWDSTFGAHVLHDDGVKSPCVLDPSLEKKFPYLTRRKHLEEALRVAGGNHNAPSFWKMARGFPTPVATGTPPVLDPSIAESMHVQDPWPGAGFSDIVATAAGIDPSWTEGGDKAVRARCYVRKSQLGQYYLDFTNGLERLKIDATDRERPPVMQMRTQAIAMARRPFDAPFRNTAVDSSGNQGLADDLFIYAGADCLAVNFANKASDTPMRAGTKDPRMIREYISDRGTEAWCVLAEFCKAGMVYGLPPSAVRALTTRRFVNKVDKSTGVVIGQAMPMRLEDKGTFAKSNAVGGGGFGASPDDCDACAMAALAVKERIGLLPFGFLADNPQGDVVGPGTASSAPKATGKPPDDYSGEEFDDLETCVDVCGDG